MIDGVVIRRLNPSTDTRGSFTEVFYETWNLPIKPRQWSLVHSRAGTLRGMHLHLRHDEYILLVSGQCHVGLYDMRVGSPTEGSSMLVELRSDTPSCLAFPKGLLHGWYFS